MIYMIYTIHGYHMIFFDSQYCFMILPTLVSYKYLFGNNILFSVAIKLLSIKYSINSFLYIFLL